jgi:hypothetical protein
LKFYIGGGDGFSDRRLHRNPQEKPADFAVAVQEVWAHSTKDVDKTWAGYWRALCVLAVSMTPLMSRMLA